MNSPGQNAARPVETNYAGAIYGTILSMAVISASSKDPELGPVAVAGWAVGTAFVFFIAHVYCLDRRRGFRSADQRRAA